MTQRQRYLKRLSALQDERQSWVSHWQELADYILPRRSRFLFQQPQTDRNIGWKKNEHIINGTATWAARVLQSGMMAGITSPARPWFRLGTPDPELAEFGSVRTWLHIVEERIRWAFARSNVYDTLHLFYGDLGTPGTAVMFIDEDPETILRCYSIPIGQFCLANSARGTVDTLYRELSMTVGQLIEKFGYKKVSPLVQAAYDDGNYDTWHSVVHVTEPNRSRVPGRLGPEGMGYKSCWFEQNGSPEQPMLLEAGYEGKPFVGARWSVTSEDVYGSSPGMEALGDIKALQLLERRKAQAVDKIVTPPMRAPASLRHQRISLLPGDVTYGDANQAGQVLAPAFEIQSQSITVVSAAIAEHAQRIKTAYFADLWLAFIGQDQPNMTAREVTERHEEKMLQLGPVIERLQSELLQPLIDRTFDILQRNGMIPPPPEELQGVELKVEYISMLAQAQKIVATAGIERLFSFAGNIGAAIPEALDKLNTDQAIDEYAAALGVKPELVNTDEEVAKIRADRAKAKAAQAQATQQAAQVQGAKVLSETDTSGDNALTRLMGQMGMPAGKA